MKKSNGTLGFPWAQVGLSVLCAVLALILVAMIFVTAYVDHFLGQINYVTDPTGTEESLYTDPSDPDSTETHETMSPTYTGPSWDPTYGQVDPDMPSTVIADERLINILLVGQDRRPGQGRQRSDTMILVTINMQDKTLTMTSFMRDLYVSIPDYKATKLNAAYQRGGFSLLCETLLVNFGVHVDGCVEVDFTGFANIIDLVGGVDIEMRESEVNYLNKNYPGFDLKVGVNHLNGQKALAYSRVRAIGSDYERTLRQRKVLTQVFNKCKNLNLQQMTELLNKALPLLTTNMTSRQITNYMINLFPIISQCEVRSLRIPADRTFEEVDSFLVPDLEKNRQLLITMLMPK